MNILCVDSSPWGLLDLKRKVKTIKPNARVYGFRDPDKALSLARREGCDVLLTEIDMGASQREGLDFARQMQAINPTVNIIFVTTFEEADFARDVIQMRASGFVRKPFKAQKLAEEFANLRYTAV